MKHSEWRLQPRHVNPRIQEARQEIRNFVNEGLKDVQENALYDFEDVFDELESRYKVERV